MGLCDRAPAVEVGHHHIAPADPVRVAEAVGGGHVHPDVPGEYADLDAYRAAGGYGLLERLLSGRPRSRR
jgi:formate dehydrogenase